MVGGSLLLIALFGAIPAPVSAETPHGSAECDSYLIPSVERIAFEIVDEAKPGGASDATPPEKAIEGGPRASRDAALVRDLFADESDSATGEDGPRSLRAVLAGWPPPDPWESTLSALQAPKAAIHFDEVIANARAEEETQAALAQTAAALTARTESRAHCASLAEAEACAAGGIVVVALLVAFGILAWSLRRVARSRDELLLQGEALLVLASIIKSTESRPWAAELQLLIRHALRDRRSSECIRRLLRRHRDLRLRALNPATSP